jgi:hypothetical protein
MIGGLFQGSGLNDYGLGDFLGTRDRGNRLSIERRLLELILQASSHPDLQAALPGFRLSGASDTERPAEGGFFGLSNNPLGEMLGLAPESTNSSSLRDAMTLESLLAPRLFSRKKKSRAGGGAP